DAWRSRGATRGQRLIGPARHLTAPPQPEHTGHYQQQRHAEDVAVLDRAARRGAREHERRWGAVLGPDGDQRIVLCQPVDRVLDEHEVLGGVTRVAIAREIPGSDYDHAAARRSLRGIGSDRAREQGHHPPSQTVAAERPRRVEEHRRLLHTAGGWW